MNERRQTKTVHALWVCSCKSLGQAKLIYDEEKLQIAVPVRVGMDKALLRRGMRELACLMVVFCIWQGFGLHKGICICHNSLAGTVKACAFHCMQIFSIEKKTKYILNFN